MKAKTMMTTRPTPAHGLPAMALWLLMVFGVVACGDGKGAGDTPSDTTAAESDADTDGGFDATPAGDADGETDDDVAVNGDADPADAGAHVDADDDADTTPDMDSAIESDADSGGDADTGPPPEPPVVFLRAVRAGTPDGSTWETAFTDWTHAFSQANHLLSETQAAKVTIYVEEGCCGIVSGANLPDLWLFRAEILGGRGGNLTGTDPGEEVGVSEFSVSGQNTSNVAQVMLGTGVKMRKVRFHDRTHLHLYDLIQVHNFAAEHVYQTEWCSGLVGSEVAVGNLWLRSACAEFAMTAGIGTGINARPAVRHLIGREPIAEVARNLPDFYCRDGACFLSRTMVGSGFQPSIGPMLVATIIDPDAEAWVSFNPRTTPGGLMIHYVLEAPAINGPYTVMARTTTLVFDGAASPRFHLPDPDKFYALAWSPSGILDPNERYDEGLSGQVLDGFGTTAGLIVAKYPEGGHEVGARVDPQVLIFDRVQQMDVIVHQPPL